MQPLARATMLARRKMGFVVAPHLGGDTGDIVSPARQDASYYPISALTHDVYSVIVSSGSFCDASTSRFCQSDRRSASACSAQVRAISGWLFASERCARIRKAA